MGTSLRTEIPLGSLDLKTSVKGYAMNISTRKRRTAQILSLIVSVLFLSPLTAYGADSKGAVRIGIILSLSGFGQKWGEQARRGAELALKEINSEGGINGEPLTFILEDSASTPSRGVSSFQKLTEIDHVNVVVGDIISFVTLPLVPIANRKQVLLVTPSIFDNDMPDDSAYFFSTCPRKNSIRPSVANFFALKPNVKRLAILCADNSWGKTYLDVWQSEAQHAGVEVVSTICTSDMTSDFHAEILRVKAVKSDALVLPFGVDRALRRVKELNLPHAILSTSSVAEALDAGLSPEIAEGVYFNDWVASPEFRDKFEKRFHANPIMEPQNTYEAVRAVAYALRKNRNDPRSALMQLKYQGVGGTIDFTSSHSGNYANSMLMTVRDGKIVPADSADTAKASRAGEAG